MKNYNLKMIYLSSSQPEILIGPSRLCQVQIHHGLRCQQYSELTWRPGANVIMQIPVLLAYRSNPLPGRLGDTFQ